MAAFLPHRSLRSVPVHNLRWYSLPRLGCAFLVDGTACLLSVVVPGFFSPPRTVFILNRDRVERGFVLLSSRAARIVGIRSDSVFLEVLCAPPPETRDQGERRPALSPQLLQRARLTTKDGGCRGSSATAGACTRLRHVVACPLTAAWTLGGACSALGRRAPRPPRCTITTAAATSAASASGGTSTNCLARGLRRRTGSVVGTTRRASRATDHRTVGHLRVVGEDGCRGRRRRRPPGRTRPPLRARDGGAAGCAIRDPPAGCRRRTLRT